MIFMRERFAIFTIQISRLQKLVQKLKTDGMSRFGLKGVDALCLYQLAQQGTMTFAELSEQCDLDPALISRTMAGLSRKGIVRKDGGKYKGRYSLTPEGAALASQISGIISRIQTQADQGISEEDLLIFYRVLGRLTENLERLNNTPEIFSTTTQKETTSHEY